MAQTTISERQRRLNLELLRKFTLFDDTFMTAVLDGNLECTGYIISTILGMELKVTEAKAQNTIENLKGRSVRLDVKAVDSENRLYDIEVQRESKGAKPRRARYNGSLMDSSFEDSGAYGEKLPETYVIFITEKDYWKEGLPAYRFDRKCSVGGRELPLGDGLHIIYVNGEYRGKDRLGDLMHDFSCANPDEMKTGVLKKHVAPYKAGEGGCNMCEIMEYSNRMAVEERDEEIILNFLKENVPVPTIARAANLPEERILEIQRKMLEEA